MNPKIILLTGSDGFLGANCAAWFYQHPLPGVRLVAHTTDRATDAKIHGTLADPETARRIVAEVKPDIIFHCANRTPCASRQISDGEFRRDNAQATENVVLAASALPDKPYLLFLSTAGVYPSCGLYPRSLSAQFRSRKANAQCESPGRTVVDVNEADAQPLGTPGLSPYVTSKLEAEQFVRGYAGPWTILRKPTVVGNGEDSGNFLYRLALYQLENKIPGAEMLQRCADYVAAGDVSKAMQACIKTEASHGQIFNIGSGRATTGYQAFAGMADTAAELGLLPARASPLPEDLTAAAPGTVLNIDKARLALDYQPQIRFDAICAMVWRDIKTRPSPQAYLRGLFPDFK